MGLPSISEQMAESLCLPIAWSQFIFSGMMFQKVPVQPAAAKAAQLANRCTSLDLTDSNRYR